MAISWNTVIFKFRSIFATDERRIVSGIAFHYNTLGNPVEPCFFFWHGSMGFPKTTMKGHSQHNPSLIGRKNQAKFKNDRISSNGHRIKTTQPNLMILVSFSSAEDVWSKEVNKYNTFSSEGTENPPFRFFWDTRYSFWSLAYRCKCVWLTSIPNDWTLWVLLGSTGLVFSKQLYHNTSVIYLNCARQLMSDLGKLLEFCA